MNVFEPLDGFWWFVPGIWHSYWEYDNYKRQSATISDIGFTTNFKVYLQTQETWLAVREETLVFLSFVAMLVLQGLSFVCPVCPQ